MAETKRGPVPPLKALVGFTIYLLTMPAALIAAAGRLDWWEAWIATAITLFFVIGSRVLVARRDPGLLQERSEALSAEDVPVWDRVLTVWLALVSPLIVWTVAGLGICASGGQASQ